MMLFFSNRLGCLGSILVSAIGTFMLLLLLGSSASASATFGSTPRCPQPANCYGVSGVGSLKGRDVIDRRGMRDGQQQGGFR